MHCDDLTDDTTAFNNLLAAVYAAGGGEIRVTPGKTSLILGQITVPNDSAGSYPSQRALKITGAGSTSNGFWAPITPSGSTLDMRYDAPIAKILTEGSGTLEITGINFIDGGSDCADFIFTSNTNLQVHQNTFQGTASGASACNEGIVLGGTNPTTTVGNNAAFQGYGTAVIANTFSQIRYAVVLQNYSNASQISYNVVSANSGNPTGGAFLLQRAYVAGYDNGVYGNLFLNNLIEVANYKYGIDLEDGAETNTLIANSCYDAGASYTACTYANAGVSGTNNNLILCAITAGKPCLSESTPSIYNTVFDPSYPLFRTQRFIGLDIDTAFAPANGYIKLGAGSGSLLGYAQWFDPAGVSMAVLGDNATGALQLILQNGAAFQLTGGNMQILDTNFLEVGTGANGYVSLVPSAGVGPTGYAGFYNSAGQRLGFVGGDANYLLFEAASPALAFKFTGKPLLLDSQPLLEGTNTIIDTTGHVAAGGGTNVVYRCTTAGAVLPIGSLTIDASACGTSTDTAARVQ